MRGVVSSGVLWLVYPPQKARKSNEKIPPDATLLL